MLVVVLLSGATSAAAQGNDFTHSYTLSGTDITLHYPDGWNVGDESSAVYFTGRETQLHPFWYMPEDFAYLDIEAGNPASAIRRRFIDSISTEGRFDPAKVQLTTIDGRAMWTYEYSDVDYKSVTYDTVLAVVELPDGTVLTGRIYPLTESHFNEGEREMALRILASAAPIAGKIAQVPFNTSALW